SLRLLIDEALHRFFLRRAVAAADVRIFTHPGFRDYFLPPEADAMINPASWIEEGDIVSAAALAARHQARGDAGPLKLIFAGRLIPEKGVLLLKEAVLELAAEGAPIELSILGEGPLLPLCRELESKFSSGSTRVVCLGEVRYGADFFE